MATKKAEGRLNTTQELEDAYREIMPDFDAAKLPVDQVDLRPSRPITVIRTVTTYGAYDEPV